MSAARSHESGSDILEQKKQNESKPLSQLFVPLENIVLDYTNSISVDDDEYFDSSKYDPAKIGVGRLTLFQNRLAVMTLLRHAVRGEYKEVDAMLTKNPSLLLEKDTIIDFSGRKHLNRTVYQLALGAKDCDVISGKGNKVVNGMIEMIEKHFNRLPNRNPEEIASIMQKQYDEQFPAEYEEIEAKQDASDLAAYDAVMSVIKKATNPVCQETDELENEIFRISKEKFTVAEDLKSTVQSILKANNEDNFATAFNALKIYIREKGLIKNDAFDFTVLEAIYRFRNHLEPKNVFTIGKHFNHKLLDRAATNYYANTKAFSAGFTHIWNGPKNALWWQKIFGYIQRFVPACDGQVIAQGVYYVLVDGAESKRSFNFVRIYSKDKYYPINSNPGSMIGYNCGATAGGMMGINAWQWVGGSSDPEFYFKTLCRAKTPSPRCYADARDKVAKDSLHGSLRHYQT